LPAGQRYKTSPPVVLASAQGNLNNVAVDANNVYWADGGTNGTILQLPIGGGTALTLATGQGVEAFVAVDSNFVYWTTEGPPGNSQGAGSIARCAIGTNCGSSPTVLASGRTSPEGIAVDATDFYWTEVAGAVLKCPLASAIATTASASRSCSEARVPSAATRLRS
jgi:hypothetical protein